MKTIAAKTVQGILYTGRQDHQVTGDTCAVGFSDGAEIGCGRGVGGGCKVTRSSALVVTPKREESRKDDGRVLEMEAYRMTIKKLLPIAAAAVLLIGLAVTPAAADSITYNLTVPNTALSSYPSPYASVNIDLTSSTTATITFTGLTSTNATGTFTYILGTKNAANVNVNSTNFSVSAVTFTGGCTTSGCPDGGTGFANTGSGNVSGFGSFNLTFKNNDGYQDAVNSLTFTLTNNSGTWSKASNVLIANSLGNFAAGHVFATGSTCSGACVTGFASNGGGSFVPEANTGLLLGFALFGLGLVFWRRGMFAV